jgi:imidazolonepropionase
MLDLLLTGISQLVTPLGAGLHRGATHSELFKLEHAALGFQNGLIAWVGLESNWSGETRETINLEGRAVIPGLVDPHTHAVWAGNRLNDFEARASGIGYESILATGGGIRSTMKFTAEASLETLVNLALPRLAALIRSGATTIEVKSGYGFTLEAELKMLMAVRELQSRVSAHLEPSLLIHVPPKDSLERGAYLDMVVNELIPQVAVQKLATAVDVFVEREAFNVPETEMILKATRANNLAIKLHVDQFHAIGGLELGIQYGALSVDHLEASGEAQIAALASSNTVGVILPGVTLHLGLPAAPGRKLIDAGAAVAVGTDLNPGSSPVFSVQLALALGVRLNGLTPAEALIASTVNAAAALGLHDRGRLELGCRADVLVLEGADWRAIAYSLGQNPVRQVFIGGHETQGAERQGAASDPSPSGAAVGSRSSAPTTNQLT